MSLDKKAIKNKKHQQRMKKQVAAKHIRDNERRKLINLLLRNWKPIKLT